MTWDTLAQTHLSSRAAYGARWLVWVKAKTLAGAAAPLGLWTGDDHESLTVEGEARLYYGALGDMQIPPLTYAGGTEIQGHEITMAVTPETEVLIRGSNIRFAPVDIHCALYDDTGDLLDIRRMFRGTVDGAPIFTPALNGVASCSLKVVSSARAGTMTENGKKSDQSQKQRGGDRIRRYGSLGTTPSDPWGGKA